MEQIYLDINVLPQKGISIAIELILPYDLENQKGGKMPFWTLFWVIVPPVVLLFLELVYFFKTGGK